MGVDLHPVKQETFNTSTYVNVDPKGLERKVDVFTRTDFGLYMARGANHPHLGYMESWLPPDLGLRANIFHYRAGAQCNQDFYIDVADIAVSGNVWHTRDLYVDLVTLNGRPVDVLDIDELAAATSAGLITAAEAERAIEVTLRAVDGITRHGDDAMTWLRSCGMDLTWAESVQLAEAD